MNARSFEIPASGNQNSKFPRRNRVQRRHQWITIGLVLPLFVFALIGIPTFGAANPETATPQKDEWRLTWSDEFNGTTNTTPESDKWTVQVGGHWANNEQQYYTNRPQNIHVANGNLVITAAAEEYSGADGVSRSYTSARIESNKKFSQKYGRFEARIKVPEGQGMWPAFWLLGDDIHEVNWPKCGEIDIMENVGSKPSTVLGTLHGPGYSGSNGLSANFVLPGQKNFSDDFHVMAVEWEPNVIRFYVDGNLYSTRTPADLPNGAKWVFDHPFFVIINLAVGGNLPGFPDATTHFPQSMLVDYVRVYERK